MEQVADKDVLVDEIINFNGPEDDADDNFDDDFELEEFDAIGDFEDFDDDDL